MYNISFKQCNISNYKQGRAKPIEYIVIHYTANNGDTAKNNVDYFANNANLSASAHYFVDENNTVWQSVKDTDTAWHCGTSGQYKHVKCRNTNAIGIEMCSRKDSYGRYYFKNKTIFNTIELTKKLMKEYNIPIENVIRHYDVTGKICPAPFVNDTEQWNNFIKEIGKGEEELTQEQFEKMYATMIEKKKGDNPSLWAIEACIAAKASKVFNGDGAGNFNWSDPVTREALAVVLKNAKLI